MLNKLKCFLNMSLAVLFLFAFLGHSRAEKGISQDAPIPVKVMKVELKTIQNTLNYVGDIKAQDEVWAYPKVSGKIIEKLKDEGEKVSKGEIIAYIDRDEVGFRFENSPVESPLTGVIGRIRVDIGAAVTPQSPIALIVNMNKVKIYLDIPEAYLSKISLGLPAEITVPAYPDEKFTGVVSKISPVLDLETRTAPVEIILVNNDQRLKSGMFAGARLIVEEHKDVPVILKEAVLGKSPNEYVYVAGSATARLRNIKLGIRQGADYEVLEGLKEGDLVVIMGQQRLRDGAAVSVEQGNNQGEE